MKKSTKIKAGLLLTTLACAAGATAAAVILIQKKREEEVYHEAELKAMDELEEMMRREPMESDAEEPQAEETEIKDAASEASDADEGKPESASIDEHAE